MHRKAASALTLVGRIAAVAMLGLLALFIASYDSARLRTLGWGYEAACPIGLITTQPGYKQTLIVGTSRTMQGVSADRMTETMKARPGSYINLSQNGRDTDLQYLLVEELASRNRLERVVIELSVGNAAGDEFARQAQKQGRNFQTRASYIRSEGAAGFADSRQLVDALAGLPLFTQAYEYTHIFVTRYSQTIKVVLREAARFAGLALPSTAVFDQKEKFGCRLLPVRKEILVPPTSRHLDSSQDYFERDGTRFDRSMYRKLAQLAHRRDFDLVFLRMPDRFSPPDSGSFVAATRANLGMDLIMPPRELVDRLRKGNFADETHLDPEGADIFSDWLARTLADRDARRGK